MRVAYVAYVARVAFETCDNIERDDNVYDLEYRVVHIVSCDDPWQDRTLL